MKKISIYGPLLRPLRKILNVPGAYPVLQSSTEREPVSLRKKGVTLTWVCARHGMTRTHDSIVPLGR